MAKFTVIKLETANAAYRLGENDLDKITFLRTGYNKGYQFDGPVYVLTYIDNNVKLIPAGCATIVDIRKEETAEEASAESEVELPQ